MFARAESVCEDEFSLHAAMTIRSRTLLASVLLVALIAAVSNVFMRPELVQGFLWQSNAPELASVDPSFLKISLPQQSGKIEYGSQAEVARFTLSAEESYTLRYLTVEVVSDGLQMPGEPQEWRLYRVEEGRVDFNAMVGYGEAWSESFLKVRLYSTGSVAHFGEAGSSTFALVTSILKDETGVLPTLQTELPSALPEGFDWAFVPGTVERPWMNVETTMGSEKIFGLPTEWVEKL